MQAYTIITAFRTVLLFIIAAVAGLLVLPKLSVDLLPSAKTRELQIDFSLPNSSPDIIEQQLTSVLENVLSQLPQLKKTKSYSGYNSGNIVLYFDDGADMQFMQFEVAALLRRIYPQLPPGASYPVITQENIDEDRKDAPFLVYSVNAPQQAFQVKAASEDIFKKALSAVPGISNVSVSGSEQMQVTIQYDYHKCSALGLDPSAINTALQSSASVSYPGSLHSTTGEQFFLRVSPSVTNIAGLENMLLVIPSGPSIRLKDIAGVFMEEQEPGGYFRINGKNSVNLNITAREGENKIVLGKQVKAIIQKSIGQLPKGYELRLAYDDTEFLEKETSKNYRRTALSVGILLFFMVAAYRNFKYIIALLAGLMVSLSLTAVMAWMFSVNIHLYTIAGIAIAFGLMIDNAIVMIDYYHQYRNRKVFLALLASTLTTIAALCLVFLLPEEDRRNLADFSLIIVLALTASMLVALWFIPGVYELLHIAPRRKQMHITRLWKRKKRLVKYNRYYFNFIGFIARYRVGFVILLVFLFGLPVFMLPSKWDGDQWYHRWYNASVGSEKYQEDIRPITDKWLGGALGRFVNSVYEKSGYRNPEKTKLYVNAQLPYGNTLQQMNYILSGFETYLGTVKGIDKYVTNVYSGQYGSIEIDFKEVYQQSSLPYMLKSRLIARSLDWGGVDWTVYGVGQGFSNAGGENTPSFRVIMKGYNYDELERQAGLLAEKLLQHKRIQKVNTNERLNYYEKQSKEYLLHLDDKKIKQSGTNALAVVKKISQLSNPASAQMDIALNNRLYPVMIKSSGSGDYSSYAMLHEPLLLDSGRQVRVKDIGALTLKTTSNSIHKEDRQYIRVVSFEYMGSGEFGRKYLDEQLVKMKQELPMGYTAVRQSWDWDWGKQKRQYALIVILILANFFICSVLFENLKQPFYIVTMIPVSFIGLFLIFYFGDFYFDQGGYAAFVMLGGLVVNAAIFVVNDFNNLRKHQPRITANHQLIKATANRSRTILLTTIAACGGLVPFLLEGQNEVFWFSLAVGTMGGLLFSLFAVFVVLPVLLWKKTPER